MLALFGKKAHGPQAPAASPAPPRPSQQGTTIEIGGVARLQDATVPEAKQARKVLRAKRKEFLIERRATDAELARIRAAHQVYLGERGSKERAIPKDQRPEGRFLVVTWDKKKTYTHEDDRRLHAQAVAPLRRGRRRSRRSSCPSIGPSPRSRRSSPSRRCAPPVPSTTGTRSSATACWPMRPSPNGSGPPVWPERPWPNRPGGLLRLGGTVSAIAAHGWRRSSARDPPRA